MEIPLHESCSIIRTHDCGLVAVEKPAGILSHPNGPRVEKSALLQLPYDPELEAYCDKHRKWYLLNRLDAPTSGVLLLAEDRQLADAVKQQFASHNVSKSYLAVVKGVPLRKKESWRDCLAVSRTRGHLRAKTTSGKPNSLTEMSLIERVAGPPARSLLRLSPATGRTHQLRVQCASRRLPIAGDATYGDFSFNKDLRRKIGSNRMFLHSQQIDLDVTVGGSAVHFRADSELPEIFAIALQ